MENVIVKKLGNTKHEIKEVKGRPQVLLIGNGVDMLFEGQSWNELLSSISRQYGFDADDVKSLPLPMQYEVIRANTTEVAALRVLQEKLKSIESDIANKVERTEYKSKTRVIENILNLDVDAIITTNFTRTLETVFKQMPGCKIRNGKSASAWGNYSTLIAANGKIKDLYYLHGHANNKDSIVLGHSEYATHLSRLITGKDNNLRNPKKVAFNGKIRSLADLFMIADVYVFAMGLDFSEMDLWWLIKQKSKMSQEIGGSLFFYAIAPQDNELEQLKVFGIKRKLLSEYGFSLLTLDCEKSAEMNRYERFYANVCNEISHKIPDYRSDVELMLNCRENSVAVASLTDSTTVLHQVLHKK